MKRVVILLWSLVSLEVVAQAPALLFVEGNIGAGKSTFVSFLQRHLPTQTVDGMCDVKISLEPCDEWQNISGYNLLQQFYQSPSKYSSLFQLYATMTQIRKQQNDMIGVQKLHVMERSWFSHRYCFALMLYQAALIDDLSWAVYQDIWNWSLKNVPTPVGFIYLRVSPQTCYQRLKTRNRSEESGVSLEYLQNLHNCHEQLLIEKNIAPQLDTIPVLVLDGELNFKENEDVQQKFLGQILDFLKIHGNIDLTI